MRVMEMLETHQDMWKSGRLGEISATEHRIDLEPGTKPIRSMLYRHGPSMRDKAGAEISSGNGRTPFEYFRPLDPSNTLR